MSAFHLPYQLFPNWGKKEEKAELISNAQPLPVSQPVVEPREPSRMMHGLQISSSNSVTGTKQRPRLLDGRWDT